VAAVAANTFRETVRERVLYNLVIFAIVMTASGFVMGELSIRQDEKIVKDIGLAAMDAFGTLIAIFTGVGLVSKEIERRSLLPLLAKPLGRGEFFVGKFCGLAFTLLVNITVMAAGLFLTLYLTRRTFEPALLKAIYPIFLGLLLTVSLALFFSTLTSSALAAACTVGVVVVGRFSDVIRNMNQVLPGVPGWAVEALYYATPNFRNFDLKDRVTYGDPVSLATLGWVTLYGLLYTGIALGLGRALFQRRELS
jgi:ABC-type transport system involved in multi-copper enzyme maturation permease subunit